LLGRDGKVGLASGDILPQACLHRQNGRVVPRQRTSFGIGHRSDAAILNAIYHVSTVAPCLFQVWPLRCAEHSAGVRAHGGWKTEL
jgi:hypothetical protein